MENNNTKRWPQISTNFLFFVAQKAIAQNFWTTQKFEFEKFFGAIFNGF